MARTSNRTRPPDPQNSGTIHQARVFNRNTLLAFAASAILALGGGITACSDSKDGENLGEGNAQLQGCDIGAACNPNGGFCHYDPNDTSTGQMNCENNVYVTACAPGMYCDANNNPNGCVAAGPTVLACDMSKHALVASACGDNLVGPGEACDDGNVVDCDGCRADCSAVETGCGDGFTCGAEQCDDGNVQNGDSCQFDCTLPFCGDAILDLGEACDDGNVINGDGCDVNCTLSACGNGVVGPGEGCDDGNLVNGDGCDSNCTATGCGNGIVTAGEQCDDGNLVSGDGCQANCMNPACGDGVLDAGEQCDDGNVANGDACQSDCTLPLCGDGILDAGEACDDGNLTSGDGCDSNCTATACGNGIVTAGEQCDDGNLVDGDGCDMSCMLEPVCIDGGPEMQCAVDLYGCYPTTAHYCWSDPDGGGPEPMVLLQCQCPNPDDNNLGTLLPPGTDCGTADLCWDPSGTGGAGGAGGTGATGGSGGTGATGGSGGTGATGGSGGTGATGGSGGTGGAGGTSGSGGSGATGGAGGAGGSDAGPSDLVFVWDEPVSYPPPGGGTPVAYVQSGAVSVMGQYWEPNSGPFHSWGKLCDMTLGSGVWSCTVSLPPGSKVHFDVMHADANVTGGFGWSFDQCDGWYGGGCYQQTTPPCASNFGTVTVTNQGNNVPYTQIDNGVDGYACTQNAEILSTP